MNKTEALKLALIFHEAYERLAPRFGYETRPETRNFDPESKNGMLMLAVCREIIEQPAQQEPVAFPTRKAVEREIERTANPTGMHLNDGKERVALPGGTLRHMLALIDCTSPPPQRTWVGLTNEERNDLLDTYITAEGRARAIEHKLKEKNT